MTIYDCEYNIILFNALFVFYSIYKDYFDSV